MHRHKSTKRNDVPPTATHDVKNINRRPTDDAEKSPDYEHPQLPLPSDTHVYDQLSYV